MQARPPSRKQRTKSLLIICRRGEEKLVKTNIQKIKTKETCPLLMEEMGTVKTGYYSDFIFRVQNHSISATFYNKRSLFFEEKKTKPEMSILKERHYC